MCGSSLRSLFIGLARRLATALGGNTRLLSDGSALTVDPLISNIGRCLDAPPYAPIAILLGIAGGLAFAAYVGLPVWKRFQRQPPYQRFASHYLVAVGSWAVGGLVMRFLGGPCVLTRESRSRGSDYIYYHRDVLTGEAIILWALAVGVILAFIMAMAELPQSGGRTRRR